MSQEWTIIENLTEKHKYSVLSEINDKVEGLSLKSLEGVNKLENIKYNVENLQSKINNIENVNNANINQLVNIQNVANSNSDQLVNILNICNNNSDQLVNILNVTNNNNNSDQLANIQKVVNNNSDQLTNIQNVGNNNSDQLANIRNVENDNSDRLTNIQSVIHNNTNQLVNIQESGRLIQESGILIQNTIENYSSSHEKAINELKLIIQQSIENQNEGFKQHYKLINNLSENVEKIRRECHTTNNILNFLHEEQSKIVQELAILKNDQEAIIKSLVSDGKDIIKTKPKEDPPLPLPFFPYTYNGVFDSMRNRNWAIRNGWASKFVPEAHIEEKYI